MQKFFKEIPVEIWNSKNVQNKLKDEEKRASQFRDLSKASTGKKFDASLDCAFAKFEKWEPLFVAIYKGDFETVKKYAINKNQLEHRDRLGNNPLLLAAIYGRVEIFDWLYSECNLELDVYNLEEQTPFLAAVYGGQLNFVSHLVNKFPEKKEEFLYQRDRSGKNALAIAKFYKHEKIFDYLSSFTNEECHEAVSKIQMR